MEVLNDDHYLTEPDEPWCDRHNVRLPCAECKAEYQEWQGEMKRETK